MAKWKLCRQKFGNEEYEFVENDEITIGRGLNNTLVLSSIVISRNHCVMSFKRDEVLITDLKSSNGIYVGVTRIPPNVPYRLSKADLVGLGWAVGAPVVDISDGEKFIFIVKRCDSVQNTYNISDSDHEENKAILRHKLVLKTIEPSTSNTKLQLKRKISEACNIIEIKNEPVISIIPNDIINIISDSDNELIVGECNQKKIKLDQSKEDLKIENEDLQYEAFNVKQEYLGYDEEPIAIISDSDSESEQWFARLSQSSPAKSFTKIERDIINTKAGLGDSSYSQLDGVFINLDEDSKDEEDFVDDLIIIPPESNNSIENHEQQCIQEKQLAMNTENEVIEKSYKKSRVKSHQIEIIQKTHVAENAVDPMLQSHTKVKKAQMIEPLDQPNRRKSHDIIAKGKIKDIKKYHKKSKKYSSSSCSKRNITDSQKEERSRKLKAIADKEKEKEETDKKISNNSSSSVPYVKLTASNRGAFLTDVAKATVLPIKRRNSQDIEKNRPGVSEPSKINEASNKTVDKDKGFDKNKTVDKYKTIDKHRTNDKHKTLDKNKPVEKNKTVDKDKTVNKRKTADKSKTVDKHKTADKSKTVDKHKKSDSEENVIITSSNNKKEGEHNKSKSCSRNSIKSSKLDYRNLFRNIKPLTEGKQLQSGKPISKVDPLPPKKPNKTVRFSNAAPIVHEFEIAPGNKMNRISSMRTSLLDVRQKSVFSLEKITLMKILRWNPQWLNEQITNTEPPPILGHNNRPMSIFHSFKSHSEYIGLVGDLLLMEIWECLTQAYMRVRSQPNGLRLIIESLPPVPPQERFFELFNISVKISLPTSEAKHVPRVGEIMMVELGSNNDKNSRFFFVHNVRCFPSAPNDKNLCYGLALYATFTEKMAFLKPGEVMIGKTLAYINKELTLFEAMEYLKGSPLSRAILKPEPESYPQVELDDKINFNGQWTKTLNSSQKLAVNRSVSATQNDQACIQMVQGPPGTGKSSVICAIVMTYFYDSMNRKRQNLGKILICATSNAAVDELIIRLLNIRQSLPKEERFRMVRVGRLEAMHARARDVSSQQLAQRDAARARADCAQSGLEEEILHVEAKINMWKFQARDAKDPVRVAYCQGRVADLMKRMNLLRGGGGGPAPGAQQLAQAERRIIECADIVVTTLASAHNHKMRGLKGRIALCIVDEAGQAIEPETLIPLTLGVTRLTLIGDPQQLPGFICSQRAKQYGLGESLFSRLSSCCEEWAGGPVVLLDQQYRMHAAIADYPNRAFYAGRVRSAPPPRAPLALPPYSLLGVCSGDKGQGSSGANETEAWGVARVAAALAGGVRAAGLQLAVITPYSAHRDLLRCCLRALQPPSESPVEVNTVDSFQGQERDVVVVSLARSHGVGFLTDAGRMNVMLTRARHALYVCLNTLAIVRNDQWRTLVEDAIRRKLYKTLPKSFCQPSTRFIPNEEILNCINSNS